MRWRKHWCFAACFDVPDIDSLLALHIRFLHLRTFMGLADAKEDGSYCLEPNIFKSPRASEIQTFMKAWYEMEAKRKTGEITQEEYDRWALSLSTVRYFRSVEESHTIAGVKRLAGGGTEKKRG